MTTASKTYYKKTIKQLIRKAAFKDLLNKKKSQSKVQKIDKSQCFQMRMQVYWLHSALTLYEASDAISRICTDWINITTHCPLKCSPAFPQKDTQEHILICSNSSFTAACQKVMYDDIYGDVCAQKVVVGVFKQLLDCRNQLLEQET